MWRGGLSALGFILVALSGDATAQAWPTKPIRIIIPFSPGSGTDIVGRIVAEQLQTQLGQTIIVENRVGAGGTIGVGAVAKADPDGHTLLIHSTTHVVAASTYSNPGYDVARDFAGITPLVSLPNVLVVAANKFKTVKELVAAGKAKPGSINYASAGAGSAAHLNGERFESRPAWTCSTFRTREVRKG
jgi:tripartite-type tricarboxylate transporter receptor subunit TctC